jgi:hypothetical protein
MSRYDFDAFISRVQNLSYRDMLRQAHREADQVVAHSYHVRGAPRARQQGRLHYVDQLSALIYYLEHGARPHDVAAADWPRYRPLIVNLVARGDLLPSALAAYDQTLSLP